jgi:hypothetical protein
MKFTLSLNQIWLLITLIMLLPAGIGSYDAQLPWPAMLQKLIFICGMSFMISLMMLHLIITYASYQVGMKEQELRRHYELAGRADEGQSLITDDTTVQINPGAPIVIGDLVAASRRSRGRKPRMVTIPGVAGQVHVSDPRVGEVLATIARARQKEPAAQALVEEWNIPRGTINNWIRWRRDLNIIDGQADPADTSASPFLEEEKMDRDETRS